MTDENEEFNPLAQLGAMLDFSEEQQKKALAEQAVSLDLFHRQMHEFLSGLRKEQLIALYNLLTSCARLGAMQLAAACATVSTYLMIKFEYCAPTDAPSGEKSGLSGLDPSMIEGDDD